VDGERHVDEREAAALTQAGGATRRNTAPIIPAGTAEIALWGYGREGRATQAFLAERHPQARITIVTDEALAGGDHGASALSGEAGRAAIAAGAFDIIVKSPGISLYRDEIAQGRKAGTRFTSATNLWFEAWPDAFTVAITGTKGKSTTASLTHHLFGLAGKSCKLLGNVGSPMLAETPGGDVTVLELSSYQIADLEFAPSIALVTNLHPEHGPWHRGHENYFRDKMRLVTMDPAMPAAIHAPDPRLAAFVASRAHVHLFEHSAGVHVGGAENPDGADDAVFDGPHRLDIRNLALRGRHNLVNLAGAFTLLKMAGIGITGRSWDFAGFTPLPHRLQEVRLANGVLAVNDSISTIPETTRAALDVHAGAPFRLILGGVDRGQDFSALLAHLATLASLRAIYLPDGRHPAHASTGEALETAITRLGLPFGGRFAHFDDAVTAALGDSRSGETLLLSPGAPSQTEFTDFERRGERFVELCRMARPEADSRLFGDVPPPIPGGGRHHR
jgi:UDP-N-acetylmuramoyl-L-alanine---L-glutamate ligase